MKQREIVVRGGRYTRTPVRTGLILSGVDLAAAISEGLGREGLSPGPEDVLFVSEKAVGASQGRYFLLDEGTLVARPLARLLSRFVTKTPAGIGLGMPETMECALREVGVPRIILAAAVSAFTRLFGRRGDFYRIAGPLARSIDGPTKGTIPPFDRAVSLAPLKPDRVAERLGRAFGCRAAVVDINDLGGNVLGCWPADMDRALLVEVLSDNPLGQGCEGTPVGILSRPRT